MGFEDLDIRFLHPWRMPSLCFKRIGEFLTLHGDEHIQHVHYFISRGIGPPVRTALPALLAIFTRGLRFASKASGGAAVLLSPNKHHKKGNKNL